MVVRRDSMKRRDGEERRGKKIMKRRKVKRKIGKGGKRREWREWARKG